MLEQQAANLIAECNIGVFIGPTTTNGDDRRSFLAAQNVARQLHPGYTYVEIGSELGGTLVPHLLDPECRRIISIDLRPQSQPDQRGQRFYYPGATTVKMIETLRPLVPAASMEKLVTFDADARQVSASAIGSPVDLAMIDGEHTTTAAFSDFVSLLPSLSPDAVILFHDSNLVMESIINIERLLQYHCVPFDTYFLPQVVAAIALRGSMALARERFGQLALDRDEFVTQSKRMLFEEIARAVAAGLHY